MTAPGTPPLPAGRQGRAAGGTRRGAADQPGGFKELPLAWGVSRHARRLLTLGLAGLVIAVITRRAEFAGVAAPALLLLAGWRRDHPARVSVRMRTGSARVFEGEQTAVVVEIRGQAGCDVELLPHAHEAIESAPGPVRAKAGRAVLPMTVTRWGRRPMGTCEIILRDRWRLAEGRAALPLPPMDCYPQPGDQRTTVLLSRMPNRLGEHPARASGEGIEFGGVREYVPGDRQRRINWPATTRRGGRLQVNTFAAERAQDVILLVDASSNVGEPGSTPLDLALRGAAAAARAYLAASDRVGFLTYQWGVRWLTPGQGERQFLKIAEAILTWPPVKSGEHGLERLPRSALPPGALVLAFSPLLDQRFVETLRDLRQRGHWLLVVDVLNAEPRAGAGRIAQLGRRIWRMEQQAIRFSLHELGIGVVHWDGKQSLDLPLAPYTRRPQMSRPTARA